MAYGIPTALHFVLLCGWGLFFLSRLKPDGSSVSGDLSSVRIGRCARILSQVSLGFTGLLCLCVALLFAYEAPRDLMQDIASAREGLEGRSIAPLSVTPIIKRLLETETEPISFLGWWPYLDNQVEQHQAKGLEGDWVQAHPPFMTLLVAGLLRAFGLHGACAAFAGLSLAALVVTLWIIIRGLTLDMTIHYGLFLLTACLGWYPAASSLLYGQAGLLVMVFLVGGWYLLRSDRPILAGLAVAPAIALRLYPGLILVYFLFRSRRAFLSAVIVLALLSLLPAAEFGWQSYADYYQIVRHISDSYGNNTGNVSVRGAIARITETSGFGHDSDKSAYVAAFVASGAALVYLAQHQAGKAKMRASHLDAEYSLFITFMVILSPIAWYHYLTILILPLAVLGKHVIGVRQSKTHLLAFWGIALLLSVPRPPLSYLADTLERAPYAHGISGLLHLLPFIGLVALAGWLAFLCRTRDDGALLPQGDRSLRVAVDS